MPIEVLRVCNVTEREILEPHIEAWLRTRRVIASLAGPLANDPGVTFDVHSYAWVRVTPEPPTETKEG